jgi:hypothetical protein
MPLPRYGIKSIDDLRHVVDDDLREAGMAKAFQRRKLLQAVRDLSAGEL